MIEEFIKEYRKIKAEYNNLAGYKDDEFWCIGRIDDLVSRYEIELNIQSLKKLQKLFDPAVNDSIKDMEEEEKAFPSDKE